MANNTPLEAEEQELVIQWAEWNEVRWPELRLLHAIPNGGYRRKSEAVRLKAQGVKAGVPDLHLPVARGGAHGLYIEMKRQKGGVLSSDQQDWIRDLTQEGYECAVCAGADAAITIITRYLEGKPC